jgi:hypothetical protein
VTLKAFTCSKMADVAVVYESECIRRTDTLAISKADRIDEMAASHKIEGCCIFSKLRYSFSDYKFGSSGRIHM